MKSVETVSWSMHWRQSMAGGRSTFRDNHRGMEVAKRARNNRRHQSDINSVRPRGVASSSSSSSSNHFGNDHPKFIPISVSTWQMECNAYIIKLISSKKCNIWQNPSQKNILYIQYNNIEYLKRHKKFVINNTTATTAAAAAAAAPSGDICM